MTRIETARVKEVIGFRVGAVKEAATKLDVNSDLEELEADLAALEQAVVDLKDDLAGLPHSHPSAA